MSSSMSPRAFYGTSKRIRAIECQARLARKEKELKQKVIPPTFKLRFDTLGPSEWRVFHKQADALEFRESASAYLHVFAYESETFFERSGQRLFLVCSYQQFYHYYSRLSLQQRHHYEVIPEDSRCHLYFDLEFDKALNPETKGDSLVHILVKCICHWLRRLFNIDCDFSDILILDSSSEKKFSQHLVCHIPNAAFASNIQAGYFVKHIHHQLRFFLNAHSQRDVVHDQPLVGVRSVEENAQQTASLQPSIAAIEPCGLTIDETSSLFVNHRNGQKEFFCDLGVYTRNRNFRLYQSSKLGKSVPLVIATTNKFNPKRCASMLETSFCSKEDLEEELFLCSLIANIKITENLQLLSLESTNNGSLASTSRKASGMRAPEGCAGYKLSPFADVDDFVMSIIRTRGLEGKIRQWKYSPQQSQMYYEIAKNRWCENVNRQHKSNNIVIVVDLRLGIYHQECYDPDCRAINYRSQVRPLPEKYRNEVFRQSVEAFNQGCLCKKDTSYGMVSDELSDLEILQAVNDLCQDFATSKTEETLSDLELLEAVSMIEDDVI